MTLLFVLIGAGVLGWSLRITPGSSTFIAATLVLAGVWTVGAFASGPLHLGRIDVRNATEGTPLPRPVVQPILLGLVLAGVFVVGGLVVHEIGPLDRQVTKVLDYADQGVGPGESRLSEIESEREELNLRELPAATRDRYLDEWRQAEIRFVSDPRDATRAAERLVVRVLQERGYPESDDGRLVSLVSADHPDIADRYRHGHAMLEGVDGAESTENLRKAMLDFRAVLEDVLQSTRTAA